VNLDARLFLLVHGLRAPTLDEAMSLLSRWGYWFPPVSLLAMFLWKRRAAAPALRDGTLAWLLSVMVSEEWVKPLVGRARPPHNPSLQGLVHVLGDVPRRGSLSFPSGTATAVFAGAIVLHLAFGKRLGLAAFVLATLVSLSRVYAGVHYPGDILGGAVVGCSVGYGVWRFSRWSKRTEHVAAAH
jgi:undecaprenyl-diphosphatase